MMKRKIKVLVFTDCYIYGGSERLMSFLINNKDLQDTFDLKLSFRTYKDYKIGMMKDNKDLERDSILPQRLLSNETLFHKINCLNLNKWVKTIIKLPFYIAQKIQLYSIWNLIGFLFLLRKQKPDILHINNGGYPAAKSCNLLVLANYLFWKAKVVYQVNNQAEPSRKADLRIDKFIVEHVNVFLTASNLAKKMLVENRSFPDEKISIINNCIVPAKTEKGRKELCGEISISSENFIITQVGFLTERKGQRMLVLALSLLFRRHPELRKVVSVLLVGNGEDEMILKTLVEEEGLNENVIFLGYRSNSHEYISACDLFVLPSISNEDMPLVLLTALELGKPIIASNFAGISQVISSRENGILINIDKFGFEENLSNVIYELYSDAELRAILGNNAEKSFTAYSPEKYGENIKNLYQRLFNTE